MEEIIQGFDIELNDAMQSEKLADVNIILFDANRDGFMDISPETRKVIIKTTLQKSYASLKKDFKLKNSKIILGTRVEPRVINDKIILKSVFSLKDKTYVKHLVINSIEGVEAKEVSQAAPTDRYFSVKARFGILIEGQTNGLQTYEESIILIKAANENEAEERANVLLPESEKPYLGSEKRFVWFRFEEVLNVTGYMDIPRIEPDLEGTEVYYEWKKRKLPPENTWVWEYTKEHD
ncbi:DUF4288 domain-containing protein [Lunatibacter salilacus]|uniref:DUF4288 domain-containing protein n=1 Tax=Lunatibacter salilacus TaxID=2483804 RepID=UPI00131C5464|nr:DUF4288 domain-containing protein [Lunatibacter salilacus]